MNQMRKTADRLIHAMLDGGPYVVTVVGFLVALLAILALTGTDIYAGAYTTRHMSGNNDFFGWMFSLATTGLTLAAITALFKGIDVKGTNKAWSKGIIWTLGIITFLLIAADTYLDMLVVDLMRFGEFVTVTERLSSAEATAHWIFRILMGGVSLIGEPLAAAAIAIFPVLADFFDAMTGNKREREREPSRTTSSNPTTTSFRPVTKPVTNTPQSLRTPAFTSRQPSNDARKPVPSAQQSQRPLYNEPTYHPVGILTGQDSKTSDGNNKGTQ